MTEANYREFMTLPEEWTQAKWDNDRKVLNDADPYKWSGSKPPPTIGERVHCYMNGLGQGKVVNYFVEYGWLGVRVQLDCNPGWRRKQLNGKNPPACMFGVDLESRQKNGEGK
jgi:hypothetical protein